MLGSGGPPSTTARWPAAGYYTIIYNGMKIPVPYRNRRYWFTLVNMAKFACLVPCAFKYRLRPTLAYIALAYYAIYQARYICCR